MSEKKKPTISEIAKALDISTATVSRALNNKSARISDATRERVKKMAKKLGYQPNIVASSLRKGHSSLIGIIVPFADRHFFSAIIRGVEEEVKKHGYQVIICQSYDKIENEKEDVRALLSAQVAGIMISASTQTGSDVEHLTDVIDAGKTLIMFDRVLNEVPASSVCIDDYQGAYDMVNHMIQNGRKKIAMFHGTQKVSVFRERVRGYRDAMMMNGLEIPDEYVIRVRSAIEQGEKAIERLMSITNKPDAIFSSSDFSALGAMQWLKRHGYKIPEDISIAGFGNDPFTNFITPTMSSVEQKSIQMGYATAELFLEEMKNKPSERKKILLSPHIVCRESTQTLVVA